MSANVSQCPNGTSARNVSKIIDFGKVVYEDVITMKQKRLSKKWKKCCIKLVSPFNITVTDLSVKRPKPMPFKAVELVEQNLPDSIQIKKKYLKFELISDDSKKNMEVQCYDIDQYMNLTACINYMFALERFIGGQDLESEEEEAETASVEAEQNVASTSVTDVGHDEATEGKDTRADDAAVVSEDDRADQHSVSSAQVDSTSSSGSYSSSDDCADDDDDDDELWPSSTGPVFLMTSTPLNQSMTSVSSAMLFYPSSVEDLYNPDTASAESGSDSRGSALNSDSHLSAPSTVTPGNGIANMQQAFDPSQCPAVSASVPLMENSPAENITSKESPGSIQEAAPGVSIFEDRFVDSKQIGAGDFLQSEQQLCSPSNIDVGSLSSESDKAKVSLSVQAEPEQAPKQHRHRRSRVRRILRWFTKCIRANDSDVEH